MAVANDGKSKGYGYVHYEAEEAAKEAMAKMEDLSIMDQKVEVQPFQRRDRRPGRGVDEPLRQGTHHPSTHPAAQPAHRMRAIRLAAKAHGTPHDESLSALLACAAGEFTLH